MAERDANHGDWPDCLVDAGQARRAPAATAVTPGALATVEDLSPAIGIAVRKDERSLYEGLAKAVAAVKQDGTMDKLFTTWFGGVPMGH